MDFTLNKKRQCRTFEVAVSGEGNNLFGLIKFGFCSFKPKVHCQKNNKRYRWVLSNLYTHCYKYLFEMVYKEENAEDKNADAVPKKRSVPKINKSLGGSNQPKMDSFFKPEHDSI